MTTKQQTNKRALTHVTYFTRQAAALLLQIKCKLCAVNRVQMCLRVCVAFQTSTETETHNDETDKQRTKLFELFELDGVAAKRNSIDRHVHEIRRTASVKSNTFSESVHKQRTTNQSCSRRRAAAAVVLHLHRVVAVVQTLRLRTSCR